MVLSQKRQRRLHTQQTPRHFLVLQSRAHPLGRPAGGATGKKGQLVVEAVPEPVLPKRILLPFNSIPLSLTEATLYQPPPPKTEDEVVAEEIRHQIQEAYTDEKDGANDDESETQKEEVDVERLARVIETATNTQLEKARARMIAELTTTTTTPLARRIRRSNRHIYCTT